MLEVQQIPEAVLELVESDGTRRLVRVSESPFLIGRGTEAGNHLQLGDKRISRNCAALVFAEGGIRVEDRGQRHGVFVNGEKVEDPRPLREGDAITFGGADSLRIIYHAGQLQESLPQLLARLERAATLEPGARDLRQLSLLLEASALLQSHLTLEEVLGAMVDRAITITNADRGLLLEVDPQGELIALLARKAGGQGLPTENFEASQTAIKKALQQQHSLVEEDVSQADTILKEAHSLYGKQIRSVIAIPLLSLARLRATDVTYVSAPGDLLGLLYLDSLRPASFSRLERQILDSLSLEVAGVLDNARLVLGERERRRMEQELSIARDMQQALVPKGLRSLPHFQATGVNQPCLAVGGDYFDLMELNRDRGAFVIADVSGKGLGAALVTSMLQGTFSAMTMVQEPASVFSHVNRFLCAHSQVERYATLFFGILDAAGGLEYVNAGHLTPLLIRDGRAEFNFSSECFPLGLFPQAEFNTSKATLQPGDMLVLYTDGITEAVNPRDEMFGVERLQEMVSLHTSASAEELQAAILAGVEEFTRGTYQADDITLLIIHFHGQGR